MPISIPKTDLPQFDRVRVTLCFEAFSEDGEFATVTDNAGHRSEIPLSSILQGDHDGLIVGDSATCAMLREVWAESGLVSEETEEADPAADLDSPPPDDVPEETPEDTPEETPDEIADETPDLPDAPAAQTYAGVHDVHRKSRDIIEVVLPLTDTERLELAQEMADALAERDRLEAEFNIIKKDYKTRIDLQVTLAAQAGETYRAGERTQDVSCDVFEDRTTAQIVWVDSVSGNEVKRRSMTFDERQLKLPGIDVPAKDKKERKKKGADGSPPLELSPDKARTCITCGNRDTTTDSMPEPCQTCSQVESGDSDNWTPIRECTTCTHKTTRVNMPPCAGCNLNADETHRGKNEAWAWGQQTAPMPDADTAAEANEDEADSLPAMTDMPHAEDCAASDERHTPDELDDIPADCIPECPLPDEADDDMPTLPPIGDGGGAGRSGTEVRQ